MRTTKITGPDGSVTTIKQTSGCGCLTLLAFLVVVFGPAAWFGAWAVPAYVALGLIVVGIFAYAAMRSPSAH
jgi:hypothetical protein